MKKLILTSLFLTVMAGLVYPGFTYGDETQIFTVQVKPNVLLLLDNSNSMDEDYNGNAAGSFNSDSKMYSAKQSLSNLVTTYNSPGNNTMRFGLMTFTDPPDTSAAFLHNSPYFTSYDPRDYCPAPPDDCVTYCQTGDITSLANCNAGCQAQNPSFNATYVPDPITTAYPVGDSRRIKYCSLTYPKTQRVINPTDSSNYIYYKQSLPMYAGANYGTAFCYSDSYSTGEYPGTVNNYSCYTSKTGTSDGNSGYSSLSFNSGFIPTDSDFAAGYYNFGQRLSWWYISRTYLGNDSVTAPQAYLHVPVNDNDTIITDSNYNVQLNALTAKLNYNQTEAQYMSCSGTPNNTCPFIISTGLTPTAGLLANAYQYFSSAFQGHNSPIQYSCQKNFVVFATDGSPSTDLSGNSTLTSAQLMPPVISEIQSLTNTPLGVNTYDIQTYVLGLGLTATDKANVDQMAQAGGTADSGGHAYYANSASDLTNDLNSILNDIISKSYGFSIASVASTRLNDENYIYEASFVPSATDPMWQGHLSKYNINSDGSIGILVWDAGSVLQTQAVRNIQTLIGGTMTPFATALSPSYFGSSISNATEQMIVHYISGTNNGNPDNWNLGDIFHSNPISIGTPSSSFNDTRDKSNAFAIFRANNIRSSVNGIRVILAGANDGQFHVFKALDGTEVMSFIPTNLLPKLQYLAHPTNPTTLTHQYFVDGPVTGGDVWLGTGDGTTKNVIDWHTLVVLSEGRSELRDNYTPYTSQAATQYWSSSSSCDSALANAYSSAYPYFCGYWAFDFTTPSNPTFKWILNPSSTQAQYLGEPWSRIAMARVLIYNSQTMVQDEKWVGFFGGGFDTVTCASGACPDVTGKSFNVVDLSNGQILWSYNCGAANGVACTTGMAYPIPGNPTAIDTDNDGFADTVYVGDLNGNIWRIRLCTVVSGTTCDTTKWSASLFYNAGTAGTPIYTTPSVAKDTTGTVWVYWGTGDKVGPLNTSSQDYIYALKDTDFITTWTASNVEMLADNSTSVATGQINGTTAQGWGIQLAPGEKVLADSAVFAGTVSFTTYVPSSGGNPCQQGGTSKLYVLNYLNGAGAFSNNAKSTAIGSGIATDPIISVSPAIGVQPTANIYVTVSGGSGQNSSTFMVNYNPQMMPNRTNMIYLKDKRVQ